MSWFSKSAEVETLVIDPNIERLAQIKAELPIKIAARDEVRKSVRECRQRVKDPRISILPNGLYTAVGAMNMDTPHAALESAQRRADEKVDAMLREKALIENPGLNL